MSTVNIFDTVQKNAEKSAGLKTLKQTRISLEKERRSKNLAFTVTPSEKLSIRHHTHSYEQSLEDRVTVSDVTREMWLLLLDKPTDNPYLRLKIQTKLKHECDEFQ